MRRCERCLCDLNALGGFTATDGVTGEDHLFCSADHANEWNRDMLLARGAKALESIAESLHLISHPRVEVPKPLPPGLVKCPACPAAVPIPLLDQHHTEVHGPPESAS